MDDNIRAIIDNMELSVVEHDLGVRPPADTGPKAWEQPITVSPYYDEKIATLCDDLRRVSMEFDTELSPLEYPALGIAIEALLSLRSRFEVTT